MPFLNHLSDQRRDIPGIVGPAMMRTLQGQPSVLKGLGHSGALQPVSPGVDLFGIRVPRTEG